MCWPKSETTFLSTVKSQILLVTYLSSPSIYKSVAISLQRDVAPDTNQHRGDPEDNMANVI
uniref:Uncharacterized protein n=1 Tax=Electrophorus electricus TaxID=8005 RepID=A0A4W4ECT7_ELEEL